MYRKWFLKACRNPGSQTKIFFNDRKKLSWFGHDVWKYRLVNTVTGSFNNIVRQMIKMSQWKKQIISNFLLFIFQPLFLQLLSRLTLRNFLWLHDLFSALLYRKKQRTKSINATLFAPVNAFTTLFCPVCNIFYLTFKIRCKKNSERTVKQNAYWCTIQLLSLNIRMTGIMTVAWLWLCNVHLSS